MTFMLNLMGTVSHTPCVYKGIHISNVFLYIFCILTYMYMYMYMYMYIVRWKQINFNWIENDAWYI